MKPEEAIHPLVESILKAVQESAFEELFECLDMWEKVGSPILTDEAKRILASATVGWEAVDEATGTVCTAEDRAFQELHDELDKKQNELDEAKAILAAVDEAMKEHCEPCEKSWQINYDWNLPPCLNGNIGACKHRELAPIRRAMKGEKP